VQHCLVGSEMCIRDSLQPEEWTIDVVRDS
jgi:hypothetical protein